MNNKGVYPKIVLDFTIALIGFLVLIFVLPKAIGFMMPFVIGWVIAMIANPIVRFLENKVKIMRKHGSAIFIITAIAAVVCLGYFAVSFFIRQVVGLVGDLPEIYEGMKHQLTIVEQNLNGIYNLVPEGVQQSFDKAGENIMVYLGTIISDISNFTVGNAGSLVKNVAEGCLMSIITVLSAYFFIADRDNLIKGMKKVTPVTIQDSVVLIKHNFARAIGGYFKAQFKIMIVITILLFIGFEVVEVDYSFLLALLVAFLDFLPIFGTGTVLFPWAVIDLIGGNYFRAICIISLYLICQVVRNILQPKMVGDSIGLSPLATLFFMFIGYQLKGVIGMIVGIPIAMAVINLYQAGLFDKLIGGMKIIIHDINEFRKY